jgi:hypothetical protein
VSRAQDAEDVEADDAVMPAGAIEAENSDAEDALRPGRWLPSSLLDRRGRNGLPTLQAEIKGPKAGIPNLTSPPRLRKVEMNPNV